MARTKINPESSDIDVEAQNTEAALAARPSTEVGAPEAYDPSYYDDVARDTDVPALALVNNTGNLAKQFRNQSGNFVLGEKLLGNKVDVVPVAVVKFFVETAREGIGEIKYTMPEYKTRQVFETATEAAKLGYVLDFKNRAPNRIEENARIGYLVLAPDDSAAPEDFPLVVGDYRFTLAKCSYHRGGYRGVFGPVFDHAVRLARLKNISTKGVSHSSLFNQAQAWDGIWTLTSIEPPMRNNNVWWEPRIAKKAKLPTEVFNWISENYGNVRA